jgi:ubiquitin-protein ligase
MALRRINRDMKEITKNPIEGVGIVSLNNDPMKYIVNIRLMSGIYEGYCVQLSLTFNDNFPTKPPKMLIYPNQAISGQYHHHIFTDNSKDENGAYFKKFCFDILDNDFMNINEEHTGWNPSYTISCLLLQVQNFLCDPDMHHLPDKNQVNQLMKSMDTYQRTFNINTDEGPKTIVHTWKNPYPEMYFKKKDEKKEEEKKKMLKKK